MGFFFSVYFYFVSLKYNGTTQMIGILDEHKKSMVSIRDFYTIQYGV